MLRSSMTSKPARDWHAPRCKIATEARCLYDSAHVQMRWPLTPASCDLRRFASAPLLHASFAAHRLISHHSLDVSQCVRLWLDIILVTARVANSLVAV